MDRPERQVLVTTCLSHGLIHVFELAVPALLLLIQAEFGIGDLEMGQIVTLYGLLFGLGALPSGYLVDRVGSKALLLGCLWGASLALLGMAASPSVGWFAASAAAMGLGLSIYHPAGTALITHSMPTTGRVFALHGMAGNTGVAAASVIAGTLGAAFGWRVALALLSVVGLILGARVLTLPTPSLHEIRRQGGSGRWLDYSLLLVAALFMGMVYRGITTFLPKFFAIRFAEESAGGTAIGGALTTATLVVGLVGMYVAGRMADAGMRAAWVFLLGVVMQLPFLVAIGYASGPVLVPLAMSVAFFHFLTQPVGNQMVAHFTPGRLRGLGYGVYFLIVFGAGSFGATIAGWVAERVDLASMFPVMAVILIPSVVATIALGMIGARADRPGTSGV